MDKPETSLQENVLTVLCFSKESAKHVAALVEPDLFESKIYREIAEAARGYVEKYEEAPGDHIADLLEHRLEDEKSGELYRDVLEQLHDMAPEINEKYVLNTLHDFIDTQSLKSSILEAAQLVRESNDTDRARAVLEQGIQRRDTALVPGTRLWEPKEFLNFLHKEDKEVLHTGIGPLDRYKLGPMRRGMWIVIAPAKRGKTWLLVHLGRMGLLQGEKVLHITLEMSEEDIAARYIRSILGVTKRQGIELYRTYFKKHSKSLMATSLEFRKIKKRMRSFEDPDFEDWAIKQLEKLHLKNLLIKEFPTGMLTMGGYEAYLDSLARTEGFVPDQVILDYPDLMDVGAKSGEGYRFLLGDIYRRFRGNAIKRNHAFVAVTQSNREGADGKTVKDTNVAEDWSKIATADFVATYTRTVAEKQLGLARMFVSNARGERDTFEILLSQNFDIGQFCLDSAEMPNQYARMLSELSEDLDDTDEEETD